MKDKNAEEIKSTDLGIEKDLIHWTDMILEKDDGMLIFRSDMTLEISPKITEGEEIPFNLFAMWMVHFLIRTGDQEFFELIERRRDELEQAEQLKIN